MVSMGDLLNTAGRKLGAWSSFGGGGRAFDAGRDDIQEMSGWNPPRAHMDDVYAASGRDIVERAEDLDRNSGWITGAIDRTVESVIGNGLQLWPTPIYDLLSKDMAWSALWARRTRARYRVWAEDPMWRADAQMRFSIGTMTKLAYLNFRRGGEVLAEIRKDERGSTNRTNILLIDPKRLKNPKGIADSDERIRNGIERGPTGIPLAAHILKRHPDDPSPTFDRLETERVPFRNTTGTPKLIHVINPRYIEQSRGFSQLVESMLPAKMLERYDRAEINAALLNAVMAFFIKSPGTPEDVAEMLAPSGDISANNATAEYVKYRKDTPLRQIGDAFIRHLLPDEDVVSVQPTHPNSNYPEFQKAHLSKIAVANGLSYAQLSGRWDDINYSSARAMLNEVWRRVEQERDYFANHFMTPIYLAWLEEEIANGEIKMPGGPAKFYPNLSAISNCTWMGPSRGTVDPLKEANARNLEEASMRKSPIEHILEDGRDPYEVLDQIAHFRKELEVRDLEAPDYNTKGGAAEGDAGSGGAGNPDDADNDGIPNENQKKKPAQRGSGQ